MSNNEPEDEFGMCVSIFFVTTFYCKCEICSGPNILGQNLENSSEHIARNFGNFHLASSPIIGGPTFNHSARNEPAILALRVVES